jgi:hypothetical protein
METAEFDTRDLHFAAYLKANGATFVRFEDRKFFFRSDRPVSEWRVEHANSCCRRIDLELIELRKFLRP